MRNEPIAISTALAGSTSSVRAPRAAAGMPGSEYAAQARQSTSRHHASTRERFAMMAATAMIGTACFGPNA
jgi:hypothetical protein